MPTQEELNAAQVELDIANDNYAKMADRYNKYQKVFQSYANASPEVQARAKWAMQEALADFEQLKLNMYAAEDRIQQAQNTVNNYNEIIANQPVQTTAPWGRRQIPTTTNEISPEVITTPEATVISETSQRGEPVILSTGFVPSQSMINTQTWLPWTLSAGEWVTAWEYLGNMWQWIKENVNPTTWVYQNNSRAPGYNLWRKIWNAVIPVSVAAWTRLSPSTFWVNTSAVDNAKNALFQSNVNKVTNIPSQPYTTNPSNISIKWTSPSNLPKYYTAPSNAPTVNVLRTNPSNIAITPTSMTRFTIPGPTTTL